MKKVFLLFCTILCANVLLAQDQLATLKHNDSVSVFYGSNAFVEAYNASTHGDVITLSDGIFATPPDIQKGITVRGNGAVADTARKSIGTYFMQQCRITLVDPWRFEAEGIYFENMYPRTNTHSMKLVKCVVNRVANLYDSRLWDLMAVDCIFNTGRLGDEFRDHHNTYINCVLIGTIPTNSTCVNCILRGNASYGNNSEFENCVIIREGAPITSAFIEQQVRNSIICGFGGASGVFSTGNIVMSVGNVFENWDGNTWSIDPEMYRLKSGVTDSIQGLDGTEVGIFGGSMPFDFTPTYNVIHRCNVANRTTADGKLSVDIEVVTE